MLGKGSYEQLLSDKQAYRSEDDADRDLHANNSVIMQASSIVIAPVHLPNLSPIWHFGI